MKDFDDVAFVGAAWSSPDLDKRWCVFLILVKVLPYEIIYRFVLAGDSGEMNVERYLNHQEPIF